jgi:hypothetical protein
MLVFIANAEPKCKLFYALISNWRSTQIARIVLELGYSVDVIDYRNKTFIPKKPYVIFVGFRANFERITQLLNAA